MADNIKKNSTPMSPQKNGLNVVNGIVSPPAVWNAIIIIIESPINSDRNLERFDNLLIILRFIYNKDSSCLNVFSTPRVSLRLSAF